MVRRAGILLLVVALTLAVGAAVAGAKKKKKKPKRWDSTITLTHPATTQFVGVVGSKQKACRGSRVVTLYYTDPNTGDTRPLSVQRTDDKGHYQVDLTTPAYPGAYKAIVDERSVKVDMKKQICVGSTSPSTTV